MRAFCFIYYLIVVGEMAKNKKTMSIQSQILLISFIIVAVLFMPTTILLFVGMMPTIGARLMDHTRERVKVFTVGFMNFAGCFPFWYQLVQKGHEMDTALQILGDSMTIIVMYLAAGAGYLIEWAVTGIMSSFMVARGKNRLLEIKRIQEEMIVKWGPEVTGDLRMDLYGFAIEDDVNPK